jgi:N-acetylglucosamine-6-phosphate deacetylase
MTATSTATSTAGNTVAYTGGRALVDGRLERVDVVTRGDRIIALVDDVTRSDVDVAAVELVDCRSQIVAPGFVDLQCNGAGGVDLTREPGRILDVAQTLPRFGVTSFLPTVVTSPATSRRSAIESMQMLRDAADTVGAAVGAVPLGLHFEGPMISVDHVGAHTRSLVGAVDVAEVDDWVRSGVVAMVTLAPEAPGAGEAIARLADGGIVVSAGHTAMTPEQFASARAAGLRYVTHLFNAMAPFSHRAPGPIGAVLADDDVTVGVICDGIHVDPTAVRLAWRSLGAARLSLVSDASAALGSPYGTFRLGGIDITHDHTGVRTADGVLAGSDLALDQAVRNLVAYTGCDLADALATVTSTPADLLGLRDRGRIAVGARADVTVLTDGGDLVATVVGGATAWRPSTSGVVADVEFDVPDAQG